MCSLLKWWASMFHTFLHGQFSTFFILAVTQPRRYPVVFSQFCRAGIILVDVPQYTYRNEVYFVAGGTIHFFPKRLVQYWSTWCILMRLIHLPVPGTLSQFLLSGVWFVKRVLCAMVQGLSNLGGFATHLVSLTISVCIRVRLCRRYVTCCWRDISLICKWDCLWVHADQIITVLLTGRVYYFLLISKLWPFRLTVLRLFVPNFPASVVIKKMRQDM